MDMPLPNGYLYADRDGRNPWKAYLETRFKNENQKTMDDFHEM